MHPSEQYHSSIFIDLAHITVIGLAHTRQSLTSSCRRAGIGRSTIQECFDTGHGPSLPTIAAYAAAVGWNTTVIIDNVASAPTPQPRAQDAHIAPLAGSSLLARLALRDPAFAVVLHRTTQRLDTWSPPQPDKIPSLVAATISRYTSALAHALASRLAEATWSISKLAEHAGIPRAHAHAGLFCASGPTLPFLNTLLAPIHLHAYIQFTRMGCQVPQPSIWATKKHIRELRVQQHPTLVVLKRLAPSQLTTYHWPSDDAVRDAATRFPSRQTMCEHLHVSAAWLKKRLDALGLSKPTPRRMSPDQVQARRSDILAAVARGSSFTAIARNLGISCERVRQICSKQGITAANKRVALRNTLLANVDRVWDKHLNLSDTIRELHDLVPTAARCMVSAIATRQTVAARRLLRISRSRAHRDVELARRTALARAFRHAARQHNRSRLEIAATIGCSVSLVAKLMEGAAVSDAVVSKTAELLGVTVTTAPTGRICLADTPSHG